MIQNISKELVRYQIFFLFVLPIFLIQVGVIPAGLRLLVLLSGCILIYRIMRHEEWTHEEMGVDDRGFWSGLIPYSIFTIVGVFFILFLADASGFYIEKTWWMREHFWLIFLPVSLFQELAYRAFLIPKLRVIFANRYAVIVSNAFLFMLLHALYPRPEIILPLTFAGGLVFALLYDRYPNLILISVSHAILNFTAVLYGFFSFLN